MREIPIDEITRVIGLATAPAFLLGAVASLLALLVNRLTRIADVSEKLAHADAADRSVPSLRWTRRRLRLLKWAIAMCAMSGVLTGWMVVLTFVDTLIGAHSGRTIALLFIGAMLLFTSALLLFLVELQLAVGDLGRASKGLERD